MLTGKNLFIVDKHSLKVQPTPRTNYAYSAPNFVLGHNHRLYATIYPTLRSFSVLSVPFVVHYDPCYLLASVRAHTVPPDFRITVQHEPNTALSKTILSVAGNINHSSREKMWVFFG
jgi:hypothetical protein